MFVYVCGRCVCFLDAEVERDRLWTSLLWAKLKMVESNALREVIGIVWRRGE